MALFASVERELEEIARLMGANRLQIFWHVSLPLARRGILSGLLLAFARSLGEFGATVMVFGSGRWADRASRAFTTLRPVSSGPEAVLGPSSARPWATRKEWR